MNDRFRFRVFDKEANKMFVPQRHFNYAEVNGTIVCIESYMAVDGFYKKRIIKEFNDAVLMQCTGIRDKNGKLIFDGDIVEVQYLGPQISLFKNEYSKQPENERFEVFCDEDWLKFYAKNDHYRKTCEIHSFDLEKIRTNTYNKVYEVIGNIYENQELLEG